jgi:hypothetical protein
MYESKCEVKGSMEAVPEKRYIARSMQIAARAVGGEMMIMSAKDSTLFTLNEVATAIWEAADGSTPLDQIVDQKVCAAFEVAPSVALSDAEDLVDELSSHGLLLVSDQPIVRTGGPAKETP